MVAINMEKEISKTARIIFIICIMVIFTPLVFVLVTNYASGFEENTYSLQEIESGCYARYCANEQDEIIVLCYNNDVRLLTGQLQITYTEQEPYVYIKDKNVGLDTIHVYIPQGTVIYDESLDSAR